jgi:spoIIIJ-associated protein
MAQSAAERAKRTGREVRLEALTPRERRIVHMALADDLAVSTRSEGEDPERIVIVSPRGEG